MHDYNLLVSCCSYALGRARREILARLRALGDEAPLVMPTEVRGMLEVRTSLDARWVVRELQNTAAQSPQVFRYTFKWVPVDAWVPPDLESMKQAVCRLRAGIAATETWRMTVQRRAHSVWDPGTVIPALAELIPAKVDLAHPDKVLRVELFDERVAISVLASRDVFSVRKAVAATGPEAGPHSLHQRPSSA
jgi:tRNA(Ser,Leu) C12 N-acetylase TAN1